MTEYSNRRQSVLPTWLTGIAIIIIIITDLYSAFRSEDTEALGYKLQRFSTVLV